jgi:hypothetical protein
MLATAVPAMYLMQQQPGVSQQQQQVWVQQQQPQQLTMANNTVMLRAPAPLPQQQQQQQVVFANGGYQQQQPQQQQQQVVYVNVNGTLQRAVVHNGSMFLANDGMMLNKAAAPAAAGRPALTLQQLPQQQVLVQQQQQVLPNGQVVPVSSGFVAARPGGGVMQLQQMQHAAQQAQAAAARAMPAVSFAAAQQQQPVMMVMQHQAAPRVAMQQAGMPTSAGMTMAAAGTAAGMQQLQANMLAPVSQAVTTGLYGAQLVAPGGGSVSANTASLLPQDVPASSAPQLVMMAPAGARVMATGQPPQMSSPMAVPNKDALACLASMGGQAPSPGQHGVIGGHRAASGSRAGTPAATAAASAASSTNGSQPGTPSRGCPSLGGRSSSSSRSAGSVCAAGAAPVVAAATAAPPSSGDSKEVMVRLLARSFLETGIALEQALGMIQPADRDMLAAAYAAESAPAAPAPATAAPQPSDGGLAGLGGEQVAMPARSASSPGQAGSVLQQLRNSSLKGGSVNGEESSGAKDAASGPDKLDLGAWGFSLFAGGAPNSGAAASSMFGLPAKPAPALAPSSGTDGAAMASMLASLNV